MTGQHKDRSHSLLSPSGAHRWLKCTKSARLEEQFPDTDSSAAAEGTLAHEIAEIKVRGYFFRAEWTKRKVTMAINKKKKEPLYQEEMLGYTDDYLEEIKRVALSFQSTPAVAIEEEFDLSMYIPEAHGSPDCVLVHQGEMHIFDFKYGKGVPVSAVDNPQLKLYALGAYEKYKFIYSIDDVVLHIVQPRLDNYSSWSVSSKDLLDFGAYARERAGIALEGGGTFAPDADVCRFCRARAVCRARAEKNVQMAFLTNRKPDTLSDEEIGSYLIKGEDISSWLKDIKEYALSACLAGREIPGWKAVEGRKTRKWTDQDAAFSALMKSGIDEAVLYNREPVSLAAAEKIVGKKDFSSIVGAYIDTPPGKPTLVKASDKRESVTNVSKAKEAFGLDK